MNDFIKQLSDMRDEADSDDGWPERMPLPSLLPRAESMTAELADKIIPEPMRDWILDFSHRAQVPIEAVAVTCLGSLASTVGRKIGIYPKRHDSFWVPCVFWTALVARPGEKKSSIITNAQRPFNKLERLEADNFKKVSAAYLAKQEVEKQRIESVKDQIKAAAKKEGEAARLSRLQNELEDHLRNDNMESVAEKRYRTNDATVEKLSELLRGNPNGIMVVRDELVGFFQSFDKAGREGDRAFYLEGWDASGAPFSVDRIGRPRVVVESLCLHVMGSIQPGKLESYVRQAVDGGGGDDGLLQRFQLMVYPEPLREVTWVDRVPNAEAESRAHRLFSNLAHLNVPAQDDQRPGLRFSDEAQELYREWATSIERRFRLGEDEHPAFVAHLSKYLRFMPALALLFRLIQVADTGCELGVVGLEEARMAATWCEFLESHARKVYAIVEKKELRDAAALKRRIERGDVQDGMTIRDIARHGWAPFGSNSEAISSAIKAVLEPYGWARLEHVKGEGRPSSVIRIHPELRKEARDV